MTDEPRRLSIYQAPQTQPEHGRYLAALIQQEWHDAMTYDELAARLTLLDTVRVMEMAFPGFQAAYLADQAQQWQAAVPVLSLAAVTAFLTKPAAPVNASRPKTKAASPFGPATHFVRGLSIPGFRRSTISND